MSSSEIFVPMFVFRAVSHLLLWPSITNLYFKVGATNVLDKTAVVHKLPLLTIFLHQLIIEQNWSWFQQLFQLLNTTI